MKLTLPTVQFNARANMVWATMDLIISEKYITNLLPARQLQFKQTIRQSLMTMMIPLYQVVSIHVANRIASTIHVAKLSRVTRNFSL